LLKTLEYPNTYTYSATFLTTVGVNLTEMRNRGLLDILIACSDNLTGMSEAISAVYPKV
jgi:transposase-like protein